MTTPLMSVVVPAHDEEAVIGRCLETMTTGAGPGELDVVVVCNGCSDDTASVAGRFPGVRVVEISEASKVAALNAGDRAAVAFPRAYVDADVEIGPAALRAVAATLSETTLAAAPEMLVDDSASSWAVRAHNRIWALTDYRRADMIGSGVYAVSALGRKRFGDFPPLIADDLFVRNLFDPGERRTVRGATFTVHASRTLPALLRRATRAAAGNEQWRSVSSTGRSQPPQAGSRAALLRRVVSRPQLWLAAAVFGYVHVTSRVRGHLKLVRGDSSTWERDDTSRTG